MCYKWLPAVVRLTFAVCLCRPLECVLISYLNSPPIFHRTVCRVNSNEYLKSEDATEMPGRTSLLKRRKTTALPSVPGRLSKSKRTSPADKSWSKHWLVDISIELRLQVYEEIFRIPLGYHAAGKEGFEQVHGYEDAWQQYQSSRY